METDGLMLSLTGLVSENELDGACEKVERLELQARLKKNRSSQIQRKLVECGEFADLYHALCTCEIEDDRIEPMLKSADDCHDEPDTVSDGTGTGGSVFESFQRR